ncbi:MAG: MATE family efflux transporter [Lachnospiraceae bacterium]|nr:MATE family efflux transporter [Lachnospiraceae bacterium]
MSQEQNVTVQENKMGVMPVNKLLLNMSLPMMASMLVQALYNIVDSIFVAKVSENALTAVSLAFPIQTLMIALGAGTGVGVNALLAKQLGEKNYKGVNKTAMNGIFLAILSYLVFVIIGLVAVRPFYASQVADPNSEILAMGVEYLSIVCIGSVGLYTQLIGEKLLQATGKTVHSMLSQGLGAIINIILDPILIFGMFGFPAMGVAGAALATVIGQVAGGILAMYYNLAKNKEITFSWGNLKPDKETIIKIYKVGLPSIIMQSIGSIMTYCMNLILIGFTSTATAVFGVYFKLQSFFFMPVLGLNNGLVPIIAYNYGAGKRSRMIKTAKYSYVYAFCLMLLGFLAFEFMPTTLLGLFEASPEMIEIGVPALRIIGMHFLIAWYCIITGSVFQALGNGVYSMIVSVARQLVVLIPAAFILAKLGGLQAVWWSFPIAELMSLLMSTIFLIAIYKKVISKIPDTV